MIQLTRKLQEHVIALEKMIEGMQEDASKAQVARLGEELSKAEKEDRIRVLFVDSFIVTNIHAKHARLRVVSISKKIPSEI